MADTLPQFAEEDAYFAANPDINDIYNPNVDSYPTLAGLSGSDLTPKASGLDRFLAGFGKVLNAGTGVVNTIGSIKAANAQANYQNALARNQLIAGQRQPGQSANLSDVKQFLPWVIGAIVIGGLLWIAGKAFGSKS